MKRSLSQKKQPQQLQRQELKLQLRLPFSSSSSKLSTHFNELKKNLKKTLPDAFFQISPDSLSTWMDENLPIIQWSSDLTPPDTLSIHLVCRAGEEEAPDALLLNFLRQWLIPEKEVPILSFNHGYLYVEEELLFVAQVDLLVENGRDWTHIQANLPVLERDLLLSIHSTKYAQYSLDTKALSFDQKTTRVHEELRLLIQRFPRHFDREIFSEMGRFLALSNRDFRKFRTSRHLTRLIASHFLMRKELMRDVNLFPERRHLAFRFTRTELHFPFGSKRVLGLAISVELKDKYEHFNENHVLLAVQHFVPEAKVVSGSFFFLRYPQDPICNLYLDLEKRDGIPFTMEEAALLKRELEDELKKRIEKLIPSVFMVRNEEEVMRNILLLSQELRYLSDLPQVMINFDKQTPGELFFTIVVVRVLRKHDQPLEQCFQNVSTPIQFVSDRVQHVGYLRKKNPKEANVFHLHIPKDRCILRVDSSINFYLARQKVANILYDAIGEFRDYNGGMILKQGEHFAQFKHAFKPIAEKNQELLENFFFSLNPIEAQATLGQSSLEAFFRLFLESCDLQLPKKHHHFFKVKRRKNTLFAVLRTRDPSVEELLVKELNLLPNFSKSLIRTRVSFQESLILGFLYEAETVQQQRQFQTLCDRAVAKWQDILQSQQELRLSYIDLPTSLDPRLGDELSNTLFTMLFEGLTRIGPESKPIPAVAKTIDISPDQKRYTFKLRPCLWTNGTPVTARDFECSWKQSLSPEFYTPFSYFFYPIKNAKKVKERKVPLEQLGVKAIDDTTLIVDLEHPTPEFLELTAHYLFSPINHALDRIHPNWALGSGESYVCNGPFKLKSAHPPRGYEFVKNPQYWDRETVKIDRISVTKDSSPDANELFKRDEIDWLGRPMRPWEGYFAVSPDDKYGEDPLGTSWCVFNVQRFPFHHLKLRQAFAYAIDRELLGKVCPSASPPAATPLPIGHTQNYDPSLIKGDAELAHRLFEEALKELGISRRDFPVTTIIHSGGETKEQVAKFLRESFQGVLNIPIRIESYEFHTLFNKMIKGEYQLGMISWKTWINDPIYTLNAFNYRTTKINFPKWEHPAFQKLLEEAQSETDLSKRLTFLKEAEKILMLETPIIPLFYEMTKYGYKKHIHDAILTDSGNVDFKWASIVSRSLH